MSLIWSGREYCFKAKMIFSIRYLHNIAFIYSFSSRYDSYVGIFASISANNDVASSLALNRYTRQSHNLCGQIHTYAVILGELGSGSPQIWCIFDAVQTKNMHISISPKNAKTNVAPTESLVSSTRRHQSFCGCGVGFIIAQIYSTPEFS